MIYTTAIAVQLYKYSTHSISNTTVNNKQWNANNYNGSSQGLVTTHKSSACVDDSLIISVMSLMTKLGVC